MTSTALQPQKKSKWGQLLLLSALVIASIPPSSAQAQDSARVDKVKAAFIYQFTNYIDWPDDAGLKKPTDHFVIEIFGSTSLRDELLLLAQSKTVKGHVIEVVVAEDIGRLKPAPIVIVATNEETILSKAVGKLKNTPSLIVSQGPDFAKKGAMINFFVEKDRLRFEINRNGMANARLKAGSQLLALAKLVE
jgi:hypothetical protein